LAQANDSILVTPGSGASVATHAVGGKEYQAVVQANAQGHILGSIPTYSVWSGVIAAAANKIYTHVFNAAGSGVIVKVRKCFLQPSLATTALTAQTWRVSRTNAIGTTGNTALTIRRHDETDPAVPAQVTAAHSATAGATTLFDWFELPVDVEETRPGVYLQAAMDILPLLGDYVGDYVLREGQGFKVTNVTGGAYSWSVLTVLTIE
jgi:hypothetical protein